VSNVLVEHDSIEYLAVFEEPTWDLFDLGVSLDIDFNVVAFLFVDGLD
jgi:hypothetical protein